MGKGSDLSLEEKVEIDTCFSLGLNKCQIARRIGRSRCAVSNQLEKPENNERNQRGRKRKLSDRDDRHIGRAASNKMVSSARIKHDLGLAVSSRTIRRVLQRTPYLSYDKMRKGPWSNQRIKRQRFDWGNEHQQMGERWKMVIFSDEKKFNLDGPDGLNYYWHDLRKEKIRFSKRQSGGGGLMFWGGLGVRGLTPLVKIEGKLNSSAYQRMLTTHLLPNAQNISCRDYVFQQDGASCHRSYSTRGWFQRRNIEVLDWPAYSPDMNITEN
jgi:transposase